MTIKDYNEKMTDNVVMLSGNECYLPGTNLLMKIRLGQEPVEEYRARVEALQKAIREGTIIYRIPGRQDMYFVDFYRDGKLVRTINSKAFYQGDSTIDTDRVFECFKYGKKTGKFYQKVKIEFSGSYLNGGGSYRSSKTEIFEGNIKNFLRLVKEN